MSSVLNDFEPTKSGSKDNKFTMGGTAETAGGFNLKKMVLINNIDDTLIGSSFEGFVIPFAGTLIKATAFLNITQGGAQDFTIALANGASAMASGTFNFLNNAVEGEIQVATPTTNNIFAIGDNIRMNKGGTPATGTTVTITFEFLVD